MTRETRRDLFYINIHHPSRTKVFIWEDVHTLTMHPHNIGAAVVIARTLEKAHELLKQKVPTDCDIFTRTPDRVFELASDTQEYVVPEEVFIFPNASPGGHGCHAPFYSAQIR